jgi:hypothetical protein
MSNSEDFEIGADRGPNSYVARGGSRDDGGGRNCIHSFQLCSLVCQICRNRGPLSVRTSDEVGSVSIPLESAIHLTMKLLNRHRPKLYGQKPPVAVEDGYRNRTSVVVGLKARPGTHRGESGEMSRGSDSSGVRFYENLSILRAVHAADEIERQPSVAGHLLSLFMLSIFSSSLIC